MSKPTWNVDASNIPTIDPHTKAKHQILEKYIENLIITLYGKARYGVTTFTFIDGFCGGGIYDNKDNHTQWEGSPIKIIKAVREGYKKSGRKYPLNIKYIFIDNNQEHLNCLKNYSMPKAGMEELIDSQPHKFMCSEFEGLVEQCEFKCGEFENLVDWCVLTVGIRKGHSFFLLDPCGWTDVSMESIRKIKSLTGSEILYTYMIDFLKRFVIGKHGKDKNTFNRVLEADGYYESANLEMLDKIGEQCYLRNESMRLFRNQGNAKYVFTFSLIPRGDIRSLYYLIHLSKNLTALEVIKESFWQENNLDYQYYFEIYGHGFRTADFYEEGQASLRFDITKDSQQFCIEQLDRDLGDIIYNNREGICFRDICHRTMQFNPASKEHYTSYINRLREEQEIEILREGELLKGRQLVLQKKDIIKLAKFKQLSFLT